jgi:NAD(P)-dependent dehydrogenase (short-subunit alcohol dehydrogenase family)
MSRACVIVLDAVGVGDLPDADRFGTAGSNTLGHVAEAVGGLELSALQQLGLGNVLPLAGCPPRADAPAVWGRLVERSLGMDTTTGHWEMMGIITERPFPTFPDERWDLINDINLQGVFRTTKAAWPYFLKRQRGRVVNIASVHGLVASELKSAYVTAKHGVVGLTRASAIEGAKDGITVNAICPGPVHTLMNDKRLEYDAKRRGITFAEVEQAIRAACAFVGRYYEGLESVLAL